MPDAPSSSERLRNLMNALADEEASLSDEALLAEARERGEEPQERSEALRALLQKATLDAEALSVADGTADPSATAPGRVYSMEVELRKHASKTEDERNASLGLSVVFRRRSPDHDADAAAGRWLPGPRTAIAAGFAAVCALGLLLVFVLRRDTPQVAQQHVPDTPATPDTSSTPPSLPTPPVAPTNRAAPRPPPTRPAPANRVRSGNPESESKPPDRIRTVFVDPQETELGAAARAEIVAALQGSSRLSVLEDRDAADARLRFDLSNRGRLTGELVSGNRVVWSATESVNDATPDSVRAAARRIVDRLLRKVRVG
jgi:hypothetical protein